MKILTILSVLVYLIILSSLSNYFDISSKVTYGSFLIILLGLFNVFVNRDPQDSKESVTLKKGLISFSFLVLVKLILNQSNQITELFVLLLIPLLHSYNLILLDRFSGNVIFKLIIVFYIIECLLAIYEKTSGNLIFGQNDGSLGQSVEIQKVEFRSNSLLGHPLNNALCVSVIMSSILLSVFPKFLRLFLLMIGFIALICFDARASIIIWMIVFAVHFYKDFKKGLGISLFFGLLITYFITDSLKLFGRISNFDLLDGSALARIHVFNAFDLLSGYDLWFGNSNLYLKIVEYLGAGGIENSFVVFIVDFGIIGTIILLYFYKDYFSIVFRKFSWYPKIILISAYFVLGSTNNGLSNHMPLFLFISCLNCFPFSSNYYNK